MNAKLGNHTTSKMKPAEKAAKGRTDWAKLSRLKDANIVINKDSPATTLDNWTNAIAHRGLNLPARKEQIALRVDADVLSWFRDQGSGWQTRMNAVLKSYRDALSVDALSQGTSTLESNAGVRSTSKSRKA